MSVAVQRKAGRGVPRSARHFERARSGGNPHGAGRVPEIVGSERREPGLSNRFPPISLSPDGDSERSTHGRGEDECIGICGGEFCQVSSSSLTTERGKVTERRPARVFGCPKCKTPAISTAISAMATRPVRMSTRPRRRPASSPTLSPPYAASRTMARYLGKIDSARMSTSSGRQELHLLAFNPGSFTESQGLIFIFPARTTEATILLRVWAALTAALGAIAVSCAGIVRQHSTMVADQYSIACPSSAGSRAPCVSRGTSGPRPHSNKPCWPFAQLPRNSVAPSDFRPTLQMALSRLPFSVTKPHGGCATRLSAWIC